MDDYISSGQQRFHSPNSLNEWMPKDFPEDNFFLDGSFDPPLNFTGIASGTSTSEMLRNLDWTFGF